MRFASPLYFGSFISRYKRFLVDIKSVSGETKTIHCPNSGSMKSCLGPGWKVAYSRSDNPGRKLKYTMEMIHNGKCWIGINTHLANRITAEAIESGQIKELTGYSELRREVPYGENSRIDILLSNSGDKCYVEVKNVTLLDEEGFYAFPDAVTARGFKHLRELQRMVSEGSRAVMFYLVQRSDGKAFRPAADIDPAYAEELKNAVRNGVEVLVYGTKISPEGIEIGHPVDLL